MRRLAPALPLAFFATFVAWPLGAVVVRSFTGASSGRAGEVLTRASTWDVIAFTVGQAALSALLTLVVGLPVAHVLGRYRFRGRSAVRAATVVPFVLPTLVVAAAFDPLLDDGLLAILAAHVFFNIAVVVRIVGGHWEHLDAATADAAAALGASPWRAFWKVTVPQLRPVLVGSTLLVFLFSFTSFGIILVLGGARRSTIETEIYRFAIFRSEFDVAAGLALIQLAVVVTLAIFLGRFQRRLGLASTRQRAGAGVPVDTARRRVHVAAVLAGAAVVLGGPLIGLVTRSLRTGDGFGFDHYQALLDRSQVLPVSAARAMVNSIGFAVLAALVAVCVGTVAAFTARRDGRIGRLLEAAAFVPLGVSAVTLGFGYLVAFAAFDLRTSPVIVPIAHAVIGVPFVLAAVAPALRSIPDSVTESAAALGASPQRVLRRIEWPLVRPAAITGAGFAVAVSLGEFGATAFLARGPDTFTAPLAIFRLVSQPGALLRGQAAALSVTIGFVVALLAFGLETQRSRSRSGTGLL